MKDDVTTPGPGIDELYERLRKEGEEAGYYLNPDREFVRELIRGLVTNSGRYGYPSCPCRLASGVREDDLDIICPCDYRDQDLSEYGACYCALYVARLALQGTETPAPVPERRPPPEERKKTGGGVHREGHGCSLPYPVWRCSVCGYLCAREAPPGTCPICKATGDRFERFF
jgi:ferredoxin-thioredoxin reductase catalytic chain